MAIISIFIASACANRGQGPQGGPQDVTPPRLVKSKPIEGELGFSKKEIELLFDEIVLIQNAAEKVIVSPPQQTPPTVKSVGKKVLVVLNDTIEKNVSYTIDFSNSIVDNNEKNELKNFSLSFSTGTVIDSLKISGTVLDASNLNPISNIMVGVHSDLSDSAFTKKVFRRISKTNSRGNFTIRNIKSANYKVYALKDIGTNYRFDFPNEIIAFSDSIYDPLVYEEIYQDTLWIGKGDTARIDTIIQKINVVYKPDSVILFGFVEDQKNQFLKKAERKERHHATLQFGKSLDSIPYMKGVNFNIDSTMAIVSNLTMDTLNVWFLDTTIIKQDTINIAIEYPKADSLNNNTLYADTLSLIYRDLKKTKQKKQNPVDTIKRIEFTDFKLNISSSHDFFRNPIIEFSIPSKLKDLSMCRIEEKVDTLWKSISGQFKAIDNIGLKYQFEGELKPNKSYRAVVDSAAFTIVTGLHNDKKETLFNTKSLEEYGLIKISLTNVNGKERIQLLDKNDKVLCEETIVNNIATFKYLMPGDYYLRLYIDEDNNGKWTNGDYSLKRQPERVYYFPYSITVRAYWDMEEEWNYEEFPIDSQKPIELIKESSDKK